MLVVDMELAEEEAAAECVDEAATGTTWTVEAVVTAARDVASADVAAAADDAAADDTAADDIAADDAAAAEDTEA